MKKRILAAVMAATIGLGIGFSSEAATRDEVAAIKVENASDFKYWNEDSPTKQKIIKFVEESIKQLFVTEDYQDWLIGKVSNITEDTKDFKVVATGGLANTIYSKTDAIEFLEPNLTMHGLRIIYEKNK